MHTDCSRLAYVCLHECASSGGCSLSKGIAGSYNKDWEPPRGQNCFPQQSEAFVSIKIPALPSEKEPPKARSVLSAPCPKQ